MEENKGADSPLQTVSEKGLVIFWMLFSIKIKIQSNTFENIVEHN